MSLVFELFLKMFVLIIENFEVLDLWRKYAQNQNVSQKSKFYLKIDTFFENRNFV